MTKSNRLKYFVYLCFIIIFFVSVEKVRMTIDPYSTYYRFNPMVGYVVSFSINLVFGIILGLEYFFSQMKRSGAWGIDKSKLILLGLPALIFSFPEVYYPLLEIHKYELLRPIFFPLVSSQTSTTLIQILCGYLLITSIYRRNPKEKKNSLFL